MLDAASMKLFYGGIKRASQVMSVCIIAFASSARADVTLQNDGFATGDLAGFMAGFATNEIGASRFVVPDPGRQLLKVQLLFGPDPDPQNPPVCTSCPMTVKVYDDTAGTDVPGAELTSMDYQLTASSSAMTELDLSAANVVLPQQFRIGILYQHNGAPGIAQDKDGTIAPDRNFILANGLGWTKAQTLGVTGDWIIRAVVSGGSVTAGDAGVNGDAGVTGQTCTGNAQCPMGQFCDLQNHACTFECRVNTDCPSGGTCNSLGMCVGGGGGGGGGCCQAGPGEGRGAAVLALGVLGLVLRRRRQRA